jgi:hypothetical protein
MSVESWQSIYRNYSAGALAAEIAKLQQWLDTPFAAQTQGERSYATALNENRDRLQAALAVQNAAGVPKGPLIPDFGGITH